MRIGFDVSKVVPPRDGIGAYGVELLRALSAAPEVGREHTVRLHSLIEPVDPVAVQDALGTLPDGVEFADCPIEDDDLDLFHATTLAWPSGFAGPVVVTCFDVTFLTHPECHTSANRLHCIEGMLEAVLHEAHVIAISQATAGAATENFAVPRDRLTVIPIAAGAEWGDADPVASRTRLDAAQVPPQFLLAVGTREPRKNLSRLLEAHAGLPTELRAQFPLVVVGGAGWRSGDLEQRLAAAEHVVALGHVDQGLLRDVYGGASGFIYPSLAEGFGLPILEAMVSGAPVITSDTSSMPEVAGSAALLVDPLSVDSIRSAIERLLTEEGLAERLSEAGKQRAAEFSWQRVAQETLALYARVAARAS